jgi:glycosyltransferase involved in cell wall biosynthesis
MLAECLQRLKESPELRHELAERGYVRATTLYSQEHIGRLSVNFYKEVLGAGK